MIHLNKTTLGILSLIPHGNELAVLKKIQASYVEQGCYPIEPLFCPLCVYDTTLSDTEKKELLETTKNDFANSNAPVEIMGIETTDLKNSTWISVGFKTPFEKIAGTEQKRSQTAIRLASFPEIPERYRMPIAFAKNPDILKRLEHLEHNSPEDYFPKQIRVFRLVLLEFSWEQSWKYAFEWWEVGTVWVRIGSRQEAEQST